MDRHATLCCTCASRQRQRPAYLLFSAVVDIAEHVSCGESLPRVASRQRSGHTTCRLPHRLRRSKSLRGDFFPVRWRIQFAEPHLANKRAAARISAAVATASGSPPRPGDWTTPFGARSQDLPAWPGVSESTPPRPRRGPAPRSLLSVTEDPTVLSRRAGLASTARS